MGLDLPRVAAKRLSQGNSNRGTAADALFAVADDRANLIPVAFDKLPDRHGLLPCHQHNVRGKGQPLVRLGIMEGCKEDRLQTTTAGDLRPRPARSVDGDYDVRSPHHDAGFNGSTVCYDELHFN